MGQEKELATEYIQKLTEATKKYENDKYKKENVLKNLKENQDRLAKWQQVENGNKSHILTDEAMFEYIKCRFEEGTLKTIVDLAMPLIKEDLRKTMDNQLDFLSK